MLQAPGHTDLMIAPENLDAFLEAHPLPDSPYWTPWFNGGHWVHYGVPGSPSESVWMPVWHEDAWFNY